MKKSIKASLLSALVFPGLGHLTLKKYIPASIILTATVGCLFIIINDIAQRALMISEQIINGKIANDIISIMSAIEQQSASIDPQQLNIASSIFIFIWLFGIIDSYRLGVIADKNNTPATQDAQD
jgi:hypothetical protein